MQTHPRIVRFSTAMLLTGALLVSARAPGGQEPAAPQPSTPLNEGAPPVVEPEFEGIFYTLDPETGKLTELERAQGVLKQRQLASHIEKYIEIPGAKSPIRFARGHRPVLVVRVASRTQDPLGLFSIVAFESRGKTRALVVARSQIPSYKLEEVTPVKLAYEAEKYGSSSFKLWPTKVRRPAEYCVLMKETDLFCLGAD